MTKTLLIMSAPLPTYAEQVKEVLAVGGDPWFLPNSNNKNVLWDGTIDESAHFGGWETATETQAAAAATTTTLAAATYAELARDVNAVGGDPSFLVRAPMVDGWDGTVDEAAHFGGWEN